MAADNTRGLEDRIAELEARLESLTSYCQDLEDRITKLAVAKVSESRFPFWNWQLARGMDTEERKALVLVLSALDDRVLGELRPEELQKPVEGVGHDVLYSDKPLAARDAVDAIRAATGMTTDEQVIELIEVLAGQGMFRELTGFMLTALTRVTEP